MKRKIRSFIIFLVTLLFLAGFAVFIYPYLNGAVIDNKLDTVATEFLSKAPTESANVSSENLKEIAIANDYTDLWNAMVAYNKKLWEEKQVGLCDPWSYEQPSFRLADYGIQDEIFGVVSIPKLDLKLPLYLGSTHEHMSEGAAHLSQTSIPIGGNNTNCVIAGHCGWRGASYFRFISELEPGDEVIITNLWETLVYRVTEKQVIAPNEIEEVLIRGGRDMITLMTCHPYASGGKQRYLVFCDRVS